MRIRNKTRSGLLNFRSAGVSPASANVGVLPASENAGETPALLLVGRALPWLAAVALAFAWSGQTIARADTFDWTSNGGATGPFPTTLDQALAAAMQRSPEIATAKAKLALAEAELSNTRFEVARKVVDLWRELQNRKELLVMARQEFQRITGLRKTGAASEEAENGGRKLLIEVQAKLSRSESELGFLIGRGNFATVTVTGGGELTVPQTAHAPAAPLQLPHGPMVEKVRQALLGPMRLDFTDTPLQDIVDYLKDAKQLEIQIDAKALKAAGCQPTMPLSVNLAGVSLAAAFQAVEDKFPPLRFVVRDYGILVTTRECAVEKGYYPAIEFARLGGGEPSEPDSGRQTRDLQPTTPAKETPKPTPNRR